MGKFVKGEVVVLPFPFSDLSSITKKRPALVITSLTGDDVILCQITTQKRNDSYSVTLTNTDFNNGSLPVDSHIRPNRLFTADSNIILKSKGYLTQNKIDEVINRLIKIVQT